MRYQEPVLVYDRIDANRRRTFLLMTLFFLVAAGALLAVGYLMGLPPGFAPIIIPLVLLFILFSYFGSSDVALSVSGARGPIREQDDKELFRIVENLCIGAGLPMPKIYLIEDGAMNAFATGRDPDHAAIAVTRGLREKLERRELEGVIAHELSHIGNRDTLVMTVVVVLLGLVALLADLALRLTWYGAGTRRGYKGKNSRGGAILVVIAILAIILAPIAARLISFAVSRQREYLADASAALLTRYPPGLASALEKLAADTDPLDAATKATEHLYIINPLTEHKSFLNNLFSTHPPIEERVRLLRGM
jgi:heat shock protein HtpX